jgi:flagellar motor switch protein FliG
MSGAVAVRSLSGTQKAALVLVNMSTDRAAAVLRNLDEDEALEITAEMSRLRRADGRDAERAIREFQQQVANNQGAPVRSARQAAASLIHASFAPDRVAHLLDGMAGSSFAFLDPMELPSIVELLRFESPETVAFVLVHLEPGLAAKILMLHKPDRRLDIAQCVATMGTPVPEAAAIVADVLRARARNAAASPSGASDDDEPEVRVQPLVEIMNRAEPSAGVDLLAGLRDRDSELADLVLAKLLAFEDLARMQEKDLQQVLRTLDMRVLALALKGAPAEIVAAAQSNLSERNRGLLADESADLGRVPKRDVEEARGAVVRAVREAAGSAGLQLKPRPGEAAAAPGQVEDEYVD